MKEYTVRHGQNIYDIALQLYGSIEGIFDILVNNGIGMNDTLKPGDVIKYDEDFRINPGIIKYIEDNGIVPSNGDRIYDMSVHDTSSLRIVIDQVGATSVLSIKLLSGTMTIDWGDGSAVDSVSDTAMHEFDHPYLEDGRHEIRIYGDFQINNIDLTEIGGVYYATSSCHVAGTIKESTNRPDLMTLFN